MQKRPQVRNALGHALQVSQSIAVNATGDG